MRIKHWQGYGCVNAKLINNGERQNNMFGETSLMDVLVWGNHEWGLMREDYYDIYNWLVKRFNKQAKEVIGLDIEPKQDKDNQECVMYHIVVSY